MAIWKGRPALNSITVDGQSLTVTPSKDHATSFPGRMKTTLGIPVYTEGISGYAWQQLAYDLVPRCSQHAKSGKRTFYLMCGGTTQIQLGQAASGIYDTEVAIAAAARAAGFAKIIGSTTTPSTGFIDAVITISATSGQWKATYLGQTTAGLAFNISAANLQTALRALSSIGGTNVAVTGSDGGPFTLTFTIGFYSGFLSTSAFTLAGGSATADTTTRMATLNALKLAGVGTTYDACVDLAANASMSDPSNASIYSDGTHPTTGTGGGTDVMAQLFVAGVRPHLLAA